VYAVTAALGENNYKGMLNIGNRPTVDGQSKTVEVHLFDYDGDLYDERITIYFQHYLRAEKKFANLDALKAQLELDQQHAKQDEPEVLAAQRGRPLSAAQAALANSDAPCRMRSAAVTGITVLNG
jgi:hypothetical protein